MIENGKRRVIEKCLLGIVSVILGILLLFTIHFQREVDNQKAVFYQLQLLRTSLQLFKAVRNRNPASLEELANSEYTFSSEGVSRHFLEYPPYDRKGHLSDPFGTPYAYDAVKGWIQSGTKGYEAW